MVLYSYYTEFCPFTQEICPCVFFLICYTDSIINEYISKGILSEILRKNRAEVIDMILTEYDEVLHRKKFHFKEETIQVVIDAVKQYGVEVFPQPTGEILVDMDDLIFYEVAMEKRDDDAYLVTGNQKHYPIRDFIVTPAEMMEIIG